MLLFTNNFSSYAGCAESWKFRTSHNDCRLVIRSCGEQCNDTLVDSCQLLDPVQNKTEGNTINGQEEFVQKSLELNNGHIQPYIDRLQWFTPHAIGLLDQEYPDLSVHRLWLKEFKVRALDSMHPEVPEGPKNEGAVDLGGPRKEFFGLILRETKKIHFDVRRPLKLKDYETIGKIFALSILQNGKIPEFLEPDAISELFDSEQPDPIIQMIRNGIDVLRLYRVYVILLYCNVHLFRNKRVTMTIKKLTSLLKPDFSEEGSNARMYEKNLYSHFVKYVRETASGKGQHFTLSSILLFTTGTEEEPTLGFGIHPEIGFPESFASFIPTANTCINKLHLLRPSEENPLPPTEILFNLYDYAFSNSYFGMV
ncbi:hypothetical protein ScPMuIL_006767 [Solemya velum]